MPRVRGAIDGARTSPIDGAAASIPETAAKTPALAAAEEKKVGLRRGPCPLSGFERPGIPTLTATGDRDGWWTECPYCGERVLVELLGGVRDGNTISFSAGELGSHRLASHDHVLDVLELNRLLDEKSEPPAPLAGESQPKEEK